MLENKLRAHSLFFIILILLSCNNYENKKSPKELGFISFKSSIQDSLSKYINDVSDSCEILILVDKSIINKTFRLNVIPVVKNSVNKEYLFFTLINNRKLLISTGIEELISDSRKRNIVNCEGIFFVLYDSIGHIVIKEHLNDFGDDIRPNKPSAFILK